MKRGCQLVFVYQAYERAYGGREARERPKNSSGDKYSIISVALAEEDQNGKVQMEGEKKEEGGKGEVLGDVKRKEQKGNMLWFRRRWEGVAR